MAFDKANRNDAVRIDRQCGVPKLDDAVFKHPFMQKANAGDDAAPFELCRGAVHESNISTSLERSRRRRWRRWRCKRLWCQDRAVGEAVLEIDDIHVATAKHQQGGCRHHDVHWGATIHFRLHRTDKQCRITIDPPAKRLTTLKAVMLVNFNPGVFCGQGCSVTIISSPPTPILWPIAKNRFGSSDLSPMRIS